MVLTGEVDISKVKQNGLCCPLGMMHGSLVYCITDVCTFWNLEHGKCLLVDYFTRADPYQNDPNHVPIGVV